MPSTPAHQFVPATDADVPLIRDIVRAAYTRWVPVIGREPMPMKADYEKAVAEHRVDLLMVAGLVAGVIETMMRQDHLWIENIAVDPSQQGRGYGKRLLAHADDLSRAAGKPETRLLTNAAFEMNVALYRNAGYVITATEPFMGGTMVFMSKSTDGRVG